MNITAEEIIAKRRELWEESQDLEKDFSFRLSIEDYLLSPGNDAIKAEIYNHPEYIIEMLFVVVNKDKKIQPFFLNAVQKKLRNKINRDIKLYKMGKRNHLKYLILKGRQQGFTTFINAYALANALVRKNFDAYVLADTADNTEDIFEDKVKHPYDLLPQRIKPTERSNSFRMLHFQKPKGKGLNSKIRVQTAGNKDAGRSKTINFLHMSEGAFYKDLETLLGGLEEALTKNVLAFIESTANGYNAYKELWDADNNWEPIFFEWWETPEYRLRFVSDEEKEELVSNIRYANENPSHEEFDVVTKRWAYNRCAWLYYEIGLDLLQVHWYYDKWKNKREVMLQEYPCTAEEAFLASGSNYFDTEKVMRRKKEIELKEEELGKPLYIRRGDFEYEKVFDTKRKKVLIDDDSIKFVEKPKGSVIIYKEPKNGTGYAIGGDTATDGSDKNVAQVVDANGIQHAILTIDTDEDLYAEQTYCLGKLYNTAIIAIEVNHSTHPVKVLNDRRYPKIYVRGQAPDSISHKYKDKIGYHTNSGNRNNNLAVLRTLVRENTGYVNDLTTLSEMLTFVKDESGKPIAEEGKHDDTILAYAIALAIRNQIPRVKAIEEPKTKIQAHKDKIANSKRRSRLASRRRL